MPPRYAFWTILIDNGPTAFRAANREDLVPTFVQLQRTNPNIAIKWFARGRLWESPEAEREARSRPKPVLERRTRDWRPGGQHKDPRARFKPDHQRSGSDRPRSGSDRPRSGSDRPRSGPDRPRSGPDRPRSERDRPRGPKRRR